MPASYCGDTNKKARRQGAPDHRAGQRTHRLSLPFSQAGDQRPAMRWRQEIAAKGTGAATFGTNAAELLLPVNARDQASAFILVARIDSGKAAVSMTKVFAIDAVVLTESAPPLHFQNSYME